MFITYLKNKEAVKIKKKNYISVEAAAEASNPDSSWLNFL
jgi:hypothetical protein